MINLNAESLIILSSQIKKNGDYKPKQGLGQRGLLYSECFNFNLLTGANHWFLALAISLNIAIQISTPTPKKSNKTSLRPY